MAFTLSGLGPIPLAFPLMSFVPWVSSPKTRNSFPVNKYSSVLYSVCSMCRNLHPCLHDPRIALSGWVVTPVMLFSETARPAKVKIGNMYPIRTKLSIPSCRRMVFWEWTPFKTLSLMLRQRLCAAPKTPIPDFPQVAIVLWVGLWCLSVGLFEIVMILTVCLVF